MSIKKNSIMFAEQHSCKYRSLSYCLYSYMIFMRRFDDYEFAYVEHVVDTAEILTEYDLSAQEQTF